MAKFRKRPVVIDAFQFKGDFDAVSDWVISFGDDHPDMRSDILDPDTWESPAMFIQTLEGEMRADRGDWIIRGVQGEFYPCKPDIFEQTYEPVADTKDINND